MAIQVETARRPLQGALTPPGDKSISHRALILGGLAHGESVLEGLLDAADTRATRLAMEQLGAVFTDTPDGVRVSGLGGRLSAPSDALNMGNSGTAMRLLAGVLAGQSFDSTLVGDASLSARPMNRVIRPLTAMGASIKATEAGTAPLHIHGRELRAIDYVSSVASAQIKSCVLLAGLYAKGVSRVREPMLSRDHTEKMLPLFGVDLPEPCAVVGGSELHGCRVRVPSDPSSAAFAAAAGLLVEGSRVRLNNVGLNVTRTGFYRALEAMGANVSQSSRSFWGQEPVGTLEISYVSDLQGIDLPAEWIPSMIDEFPVLMVLAAVARGTTRVRGAEELRVKESDRIDVMCTALRALGVSVRDYPDGFDIEGPAQFRSARVSGHNDHRCAMSLSLLGMVVPGSITVEGADYIETSYPGFVHDMQSLGAPIRSL